MTTYISILRGINFEGKRKIRMYDLKKMYENMGFSNVVTYIQCGNTIFDSESSANNPELTKLIEQEICLKGTKELVKMTCQHNNKARIARSGIN